MNERYRWFRKDDQTLCISGFPIQVKKGPVTDERRFKIYVEGHEIEEHSSLDFCKCRAEAMADELRVFMGVGRDGVRERQG